jgi:hypothetical protein
VTQSSEIPSIYSLLPMLRFGRGFSTFHKNSNQGLRYEKETTSTADINNSYIDAELGVCGGG